jgi:hypothetical protein
MTVYKMGGNVKRMMNNSHKAVPPMKHLLMEVLEILWSCYLWQMLPYELESDDPIKNLRASKFNELLISDIILRLCKFRDDDSRSLSFEQVVKNLRKRSVTKNRVEDIEPLIKEYKTITQNIENHRNTYIAHLAKRDRTHLKPPSEIYEAIRLAVNITDKLSGDQNAYSIEGTDLRKAVLQDLPCIKEN